MWSTVNLEVRSGQYTLRAANGLFLKATPQGTLVAETHHWDDWEVFTRVEEVDGKVAFKSFHNSYISVNPEGYLFAGGRRDAAPLTLANRSRAAWDEATSVSQPMKLVSEIFDHAICAWPSSVASVRCCSSERVVPEESYGCYWNETFAGAQQICAQQGLTLCAPELLKSCQGCGTSHGIETMSVEHCWWMEFKQKAYCIINQRAAGHPTEESLTQRRFNQRNDRASVFSSLCPYEPKMGGRHGQELRSSVLVKLMDGAAVQVAPVTEHILGYQWWVKYQPVSAGLDSRSGTEEELRQMVATCRAAGVQVIVDILLNHMASPCKQAKKKSKVGPQTGWLCPEDDCTPCDMYELPDFNTELQEVRDMQFKHLEELYHIGITGLRVDAAIYHHVYELAEPWQGDGEALCTCRASSG
eukprot:g4092.t1